MSRPTAFALAVVVTVLAAGHTEPSPRPGLDATLWVQSSAEYEACVRQTWRAAREALDATLFVGNDAILRPGPMELSDLPPAIIVDIDETVLDNSPFQARLAADGATFTEDAWKAWVQEGRAEPVPGALDTLRHAVSLGIRVFYVTNRKVAHEEATLANLKRFGFPVTGKDALLMRDEQEDWGGDKSTRRDVIAAGHRVLVLVGDDLNDFVSARDLSVAERDCLVHELSDLWGQRWFMLPNPTYGSWMRAAGQSEAEKLAALDLRR